MAHDYGGGRFEISPRGVFFIGTDKDGNELSPRWICSPLSVVAMTRDARSGEWGRLLEWRDDDQVRHQWAMPLELLQGDGSDVRRELARLGLSIAPSKAARDLLASFLQVWPVQARARCVERLGWHGAVYVTPAESIGQDDEIVVFQNAHALEPAFAVSGTAEEWRDSVAALASGNSRLLFALSVAFAGALADVVGEDSGGFHLRGGSSSGKSTALKAAASVWGEAMLMGQAHALQSIFMNFSRRALNQDYQKHLESFFRMALKAQNQCRMTLETLANIKNPPVVFAKQANIANGPQQVNNGIPAPAHAEKTIDQSNELLEAQHGERLDTRTAGETAGLDPAMATVGEIDRAANG